VTVLEQDQERLAASEEERRLLEWRLRQLLRLGVSPLLAEIAAPGRLDLHELERLIERGCPPDTAVEIMR
jgi:hypothetical protein